MTGLQILKYSVHWKVGDHTNELVVIGEMSRDNALGHAEDLISEIMYYPENCHARGINYDVLDFSELTTEEQARLRCETRGQIEGYKAWVNGLERYLDIMERA